ncbi:lipid-A-disaccharide synthase [Rhizobium sp. LjRoot254]|uniref:lipid-A-disaccharide synthase n=1 Tax=Rhizobium sp. LjRoot254 TaxID=3342297 RepID=UPI003ECD01B7
MTLKIAVIAGESSGDLLGAGMVAEIKRLTGEDVEFMGVGGPALAAEGLVSLFDFSDTAIMGISAVLTRLPTLIKRINQTVSAVVAARPDALVIIDSPGFTHRVAKKVRKQIPGLPVIQYVCPTVWAWKPYRARRMIAYVDHVLAILPFEPEAMERLGGPPTTYVGHRLRTLKDVLEARSHNASRIVPAGSARTILLLPGSRVTEISRLLPIFRETAEFLSSRGQYRFIMPTVPHQETRVREMTADWPVKPEIVVGETGKWEAFRQADAALAAAGTVLFELALTGIPTIATYKTDIFIRMIMSRIKTWSGALPNLIADYPVFPEFYDQFLRPQMLGRWLERLSTDTPQRAAVLAGCRTVFENLTTDKGASEHAAEIVLALAQRKSPAR